MYSGAYFGKYFGGYYGPNNADTHDYPIYDDGSYYKKLKELEHVLEARQAEKLQQARELRAQLEKAFNSEDDLNYNDNNLNNVSSYDVNTQKEESLQNVSSNNYLKQRILAVEHELYLIHVEQINLQHQLKLKREEDDIHVILMTIH
jgi:hypothetical protein